MHIFRRFVSNYRNLTRPARAGDKLFLPEADQSLKSLMESRLFSALPESWHASNVTRLQKFISGTFLSLLFTGGIAANYYDDSNKELSRAIISSEIHLLSSYLAFTSGLQSGLQHYLSCGIVQVSVVDTGPEFAGHNYIQKRFNWVPHYRQAVGFSGVLAAAFASGNSDVASRTVLYFLLLSYLGVLGNEYVFARLKMAPAWMKVHSPSKAAGIFLGIMLLLLCESQTLAGKTPEL